MFFEEVFKALNKAKVKYVVAGGVAVNLHGYQRTTKDLDLIVHLEETNLSLLFDAFKNIKYIPKAPVTKEQFVDKGQREKWGKEKGMIVFSFVKKDPPFDLVDIFIHEPFPFKKIQEKQIVVKIEGLSIPILSIEQLTQLKLKAGRPHDLIDAVQLKAIKKMESK